MKRNLEQMEQDGSEGGNTRTPSDKVVKRISQSRAWCFTYNNYGSNCLEQMEQVFQLRQMSYIIGKEVGESGTPHLQGYVTSKTKFRWSELKLPKEIHWEKAVGSAAQNMNYCSKDGDYVISGLIMPRIMKLITPNRPWQVDILKMIELEPDDRTIWWYWSAEGGVGKTQFCKYLIKKHQAIMLSGKGADVRNGLVQHLDGGKNECPRLVLVNVPRCHSDYLSYEALENIKDMCFYSGKYEGGMVCGPEPHLIVFANTPPVFSKMSKDRWKVVNIDGVFMAPGGGQDDGGPACPFIGFES